MESSRDKQEFNMAVSELGRINFSCAIIEDSIRNLDLYSWFMELQCLSAILDRLMDSSKGERNNFDKRLNEVWTKIQPYLNSNKLGMTKIDPSVFMELKHIYTDLRKIADESQMLGQTEEEEDD